MASKSKHLKNNTHTHNCVYTIWKVDIHQLPLVLVKKIAPLQIATELGGWLAIYFPDGIIYINIHISHIISPTKHLQILCKECLLQTHCSQKNKFSISHPHLDPRPTHLPNNKSIMGCHANQNRKTHVFFMSKTWPLPLNTKGNMPNLQTGQKTMLKQC